MSADTARTSACATLSLSNVCEKSGLEMCGARTRACRVDTRVDAPLAPPGRPAILFGPGDQSRLHWIVLDIECNSLPLPLIPYPMIVRFPLPERLSGPAEQAIRFPSRVTFQRFHQPARRYLRQQQHMDMVGHHHETGKLVMSECRPPMQGLHHQARDGLLAEEHGTSSSGVQLAVQPDESLAGRGFVVWREMVRTNAAVKVPGKKQPAILGIEVRKAANGEHIQLVGLSREKSRVSACATSREKFAALRVHHPQRMCSRPPDGACWRGGGPHRPGT